jgi:hypothetical protein
VKSLVSDVPKVTSLASEFNPRSLKKDVKYAAALMNLDNDHAVTFATSKLADSAAGWATMTINTEGEFQHLEDFFNRFNDHYLPVNATMSYRTQLRNFKQGKKECVNDAAVRCLEITDKINIFIDKQGKAFTFLAGIRDELKTNVINFMTMTINRVKVEKDKKPRKAIVKQVENDRKGEPWTKKEIKLYEEHKCYKTKTRPKEMEERNIFLLSRQIPVTTESILLVYRIIPLVSVVVPTICDLYCTRS